MNRMIQKFAVTAAMATVAGLGMTAPAEASVSKAPTQSSGASASAAGGYKGKVTTQALNARINPSAYSTKTMTYKKGALLTINCKVRGTNVKGNRLWYYVGQEGMSWVSAKYVRNVGKAPAYCDPTDGHFNGRATTGVKYRKGPSTSDKVGGTFAKGQTVRAHCLTLGGKGRTWIHTAGGDWVAGDFVKVSKKLRYCMN